MIHRKPSQSRKIAVPTFGSARIYRWKEIYREGSGNVEKKKLFSLIICLYAMEFLDKVRKILCFLADCLSPWIAMERFRTA